MNKVFLILLDAMNKSYLEQMPHLSKNYNHSEIQPMIGYGSTLASLLTGKRPSEHGIWNSFYLDQKPFPEKLLKFSKFYGNFSPSIYKNLIRFGSDFSPSLKKPHFRHNAFNSPSILDKLRDKNRKFLYINLPWIATDKYFFLLPYKYSDDLAIKILNMYNLINFDFIFLHLYESDHLGHHKSRSPQMNSFLQSLDKKIENITNQWDESIIFFSDHGMHKVNTIIDVSKIVENEKYFIESTILRLYNPSSDTLEQISQLKEGRFFTKEEVEFYTPDERYGTHFWVCNKGSILFPDFWNKKPPSYMHGYHDEPPTLLASNIKLNKDTHTTLDLHEIIDQQLFN